MERITVYGIDGIPEVEPGDDLAGLIVKAADEQGTPLEDMDILVVSQKVVSKAEGYLIDLSHVQPSEFAKKAAAFVGKDPRMVEVILGESDRIVRMDKGVMITQTHHGLVCANAGVDSSNVRGREMVSVLPADPDGSAANVKRRIQETAGVDVAVIISDTFGRPWRDGILNFAIGVAGIEPMVDYRGQEDPYGKVLKVTRVAVVDELAAASELVTGKLKGIPAAIIRGYRYVKASGGGADLIRGTDQDLFR